MNFDQYKVAFISLAQSSDYSDVEIRACLDYAEKLMSHGLPVIYDQHHFAEIVGYTYDYLLSVTNASHLHYKHYQIPKKNGDYRQLEEPFPDLKNVQSWILDKILVPASKHYVSPVAKAFIPGKRLRENARFHRSKRKIVALDIKDFFGSINYSHIYECFTRIGYSKAVSTLLAKLCTNKGILPQGAPTSPMLSNMVMYFVDNRLFDYCNHRHINYTRYADDMTFSGAQIDTDHLIPFVRNILRGVNLQLNEEKTNVMGRGMCQKVTGIVVNDYLQVPRYYRDRIRQEMYYIIKYGISSHLQRMKDIPAWIQTEKHYINHLLGKVNFVLQVNPKDQEFQKYAHWLKIYM